MSKCSLCGKSLTDSEAYEYRGFISCDEHFEAVIEKVDIRRGEIIHRNNAVTEPLHGLDISPDTAIGSANRRLLAPMIEIAARETFAEKEYREGKL